jgi:hypothetical protein
LPKGALLDRAVDPTLVLTRTGREVPPRAQRRTELDDTENNDHNFSEAASGSYESDERSGRPSQIVVGVCRVTVEIVSKGGVRKLHIVVPNKHCPIADPLDFNRLLQ